MTWPTSAVGSSANHPRLSRRELGALLVLTCAAILLRIVILEWQRRSAGFAWSDPDQYLGQARSLWSTGSWRWTINAVAYHWGGFEWSLPPGYPFFLSLFYSGGASSPLNAAIAQCVVGGLAVIPVFALTRVLHTTASGFIAASLWAVWFPSVAGRHVFVQEQVYLPVLFVAFAAIASAWRNESSLVTFALGGVLLGVASLIRAMPLYFVPMLALQVWLSDADRRRGFQRAIGLSVGFLLIVMPYVFWISAARGRLILIDDHMAIEHLADVGKADPTSLFDGFKVIAGQLRQDALQKIAAVGGMFQVYGSGWLRFYSWAETAAQARWIGLLTHALLDTLWLVTCLLAPMGLVLARHRKTALMLVLWSALVIAASVTVGDVGARYRAPMEIAVISGAAVVVAGRWSRPGVGLGVTAAIATLLLMMIVPPAYLRAIEGKAPYGTVLVDGNPGVRRSEGGAGFYVWTYDGRVVFQIEPEARALPLELQVRVDGYPLATVRFDEDVPRVVTLPAKASRLAFVELEPMSELSVHRELSYLIRAQ